VPVPDPKEIMNRLFIEWFPRIIAPFFASNSMGRRSLKSKLGRRDINHLQRREGKSAMGCAILKARGGYLSGRPEALSNVASVT
jgi:hypothetical protein